MRRRYFMSLAVRRALFGLLLPLCFTLPSGLTQSFTGGAVNSAAGVLRSKIVDY